MEISFSQVYTLLCVVVYQTTASYFYHDWHYGYKWHLRDIWPLHKNFGGYQEECNYIYPSQSGRLCTSRYQYFYRRKYFCSSKRNENGSCSDSVQSNKVVREKLRTCRVKLYPRYDSTTTRADTTTATTTATTTSTATATTTELSTSTELPSSTLSTPSPQQTTSSHMKPQAPQAVKRSVHDYWGVIIVTGVILIVIPAVIGTYICLAVEEGLHI